jgi:hypothetical protein
MMGEKRLYPRDHRTPVAFEGVGHIVGLQSEQQPDEEVREPVQNQLMRRIVDHLGAARETGAEYAVEALVHLAVESDDILGIVGAVRHDDRHAIPVEGVQPGPHREAEPAPILIGDMAQSRELALQRGKFREATIVAVVVHDDDLMQDGVTGQRGDERRDGRAQISLFVSRRNDDREHSGNTRRHPG